MAACLGSIAIVDDTSVIRACIKQFLQSNGFKVCFEAINGQDCLDKMQHGAELPDVIILDIEMPVMNGFQTAAVLKQKWPSTKIIAFSSLSDDQSLAQILAAGADCFLPKNESPMSMLALVKSIMNQST